MKPLRSFIIGPSSSVSEEDRQQVIFLTLLLLGLIVAGLLVVLTFPLLYEEDRSFKRSFNDPVFWEATFFLTTLLGAYGFIRTGRVQMGKYLIALVLTIVPILATTLPMILPPSVEPLLPDAYEDFLTYLVLPIMFVSAFLSPKAAVGLLAAAVAYIVFITTITPDFPLKNLIETLEAVTFFSLFQIVLIWQKDHIERDRRQRLEALNDQLRISEQEAQKANTLKTEFLAVTSHELKTPLNSILGFTDCLLNNIGVTGPELSSDQRGLLERVKVKSKDLLANINDILDMSRLEAHKVEVTLEAYAPTEFVYQHMKDIAPLAAEKGLILRSSIAPDAPTSVIGDSHLFSRILNNLLSNAVKFTNEGTIEVQVRLSDAEHWQLQVSDTGIGISADQRQTIFQPFRQVDSSTTRQYGGAGLGLAIARSHARLMSGDIEVHSEISVGSTFIVTLPVMLIAPITSESSVLSQAA